MEILDISKWEASGRKKKNLISSLMNDGDQINVEHGLVPHITNFCKQLFGPVDVTFIKLDGIHCSHFSEEDRDAY